MKLFNRNKKELELEFNYDEMMAAAKVTNLLSQAKVTYVNKKIDVYTPTEIETNMLGVYDKNDKLILVLSYELDKKILFKYMIGYYLNNYCINDVDFSLKLINPLFKVTEKNTENLPINLILYYLRLNQFFCTDTFNDFYNMCFFDYTLKNTLNNLNK